MPSRRILRINDLLREELAILLREVKDPELDKLISITQVDTSPDMRQAKVFVSTLGDEHDIAQTIERLKHAARYFRRELAQRINLRHTPLLDFKADPSLVRAARVSQLLFEIETKESSET